MKRVLVITHAYPPSGGGGVQRIVKFARYLTELGWDVTVLCTTSDQTSWKDDTRIGEVAHIPVIRVPVPKAKGFFQKSIRKLYPLDAFWRWANQAVATALHSGNTSFDIVFSSGPPHSVHWAAHQLSRKWKARWVADFRDHFTLGPEYRPFTVFQGWWNVWFEKRIYQLADAVVVNTDTNRSDVLKTFSMAVPDKIHTIYNGFDVEDLVSSGEKVVFGEDKIHYLYLGGLRGDGIDGVFYKVIARVIEKYPHVNSEIRLNIIGDVSRMGSTIEDLKIRHLFQISSFVAYNKVGDYLDQCDAGLTWQRDNTRYKGTIAGKVFDYIGKSLPLFSLGQDGGEICNIINKYHIGVSVPPSDIEKAADAFYAFHNGLKNGIFNYQDETVHLLHEKFSRKNQAAALSSVFNNL